jgi:hypothetical protein
MRTEARGAVCWVVFMAVGMLSGCNAIQERNYARCAPINDFLGDRPERTEGNQYLHPTLSLTYERGVAANCLARRANALTKAEAANTDPDALLGACDDQMRGAQIWASAEHWGGQYEPSVAESLAVQQAEIDRLRRLARAFLMMNSGEHCSAYSRHVIEDMERRERLEVIDVPPVPVSP